MTMSRLAGFSIREIFFPRVPWLRRKASWLPLVVTVLAMGATLPIPLAAQTQAEYDAQIRALMSHPAVQSALEHIEETDDQTMADLMALTHIPAPPFMEGERGRAFLDMMREIGVDSAWVDVRETAPGMFATQ